MTPRFELAKTLAEIDELIPPWRQLAEHARAAFYQQPDWYRCLKEYLIPDLMVLTAYDQEQLVMVLPLTYQNSRRHLSAPRHKQNDLLDACIDPNTDPRALMATLPEYLNRAFPGWISLEVSHNPEQSHWQNLLNFCRHPTHCDKFAKTIYMETEQLPLTKLSKKHVKNVRRHARKLQNDIGELEIYTDLTDSQSLQQFFELENLGWKGLEGINTSILSDPVLTRFYQSVAERFAALGGLSINLGVVNDECIAGKFTLLSAGHQYLLKISYHPDYQAYSPGNLLLLNLIEQAGNNPAIEQVNLVTGPVWAERWHGCETTLHWHTLYNRTLRGHMAWLKQHFKDKLRPLKQRLKRRKSR